MGAIKIHLSANAAKNRHKIGRKRLTHFDMVCNEHGIATNCCRIAHECTGGPFCHVFDRAKNTTVIQVNIMQIVQ